MQINFGLLIFAVIFGGAGFLLFNKQLKDKKKNTAEGAAEVISYYTEISHSSKGGRSTVHYPIIRYEVNGQWYEHRSSSGRGSKPYEIGTLIRIMYDPEDPNNFIIYGDNTSYILGIVFMAIGVGVAYLALTGK